MSKLENAVLTSWKKIIHVTIVNMVISVLNSIFDVINLLPTKGNLITFTTGSLMITYTAA